MELLEIISLVFYVSSAGLLLFYVFIFSKFSNHQPDNSRFEKLPFVSVVICAKNESENLRNFLPCVLNQKYPSFEVVVVDDNSTDDTSATLSSLSESYKNLETYLFDQKKISLGKKQVLEFGIEKASSEYLLLTDADCKPSSPYWLVGMVNGFSNKSDVVLGVGMYRKEDGWINKLVQLDTLYIIINYMSFALSGFPYMSVGRNVAYRKSLFQQIGGLKKHYDVPSGDDDLLINQMPSSTKFNVVYDSNSQTISIPENTWGSFIKQKSRHVSAGLKYNKRNILMLGLSYLLVTFWYVSLPLMICYSSDLAVVLTIVVLKKITLYTIFRRIFAKIGVAELILLSIFMDILSIFVQIIATVKSLKRKEAKW